MSVPCSARANSYSFERELALAEAGTPCERVAHSGLGPWGRQTWEHSERMATWWLEALAACPESPEWRRALLNAGGHLVLANRPRAALELYRRAIERDEDEHAQSRGHLDHVRFSAEVQFCVAHAHYAAFEFDEALATYRVLASGRLFSRVRNEEVTRWREDAAVNLALLHWQLRQVNAARRAIRHVARVHSNADERARAAQTAELWTKLSRASEPTGPALAAFPFPPELVL